MASLKRRGGKETLKKIPFQWEKMTEGGEAVIYSISPRKVAKVYHHWESDIYINDRSQQKAAQERLKEIQEKLPALINLEMPRRIVTPISLLTTPKGSVLGYTMLKIPKTVIAFENLWQKVSSQETLQALGILRSVLLELHKKDIVFGDLVPRDICWNHRNKKIYILDADNIQFDRFRCRSFTLGYADPRVLTFSKNNGKIEANLQDSHDQDSDWYAFLAICFLALTGVKIFGGIHADYPSEEERIQRRVTIFNKNTIYPVTGKSPKTVPLPLLETIFKRIVNEEKLIPGEELFMKNMDNEE